MTCAVCAKAINQKGETWPVTYDADLKLTNFTVPANVRYGSEAVKTGFIRLIRDIHFVKIMFYFVYVLLPTLPFYLCCI